MFYITFDINDREIGKIGVHNTQRERVQTNDDYSYIETKYNVYDMRPEGETLDDFPKLTSIWHDRANGAMALAARVTDELDESVVTEVRS